MMGFLVVAYSVIIGKHDTMKIIIGTYIAMLTADGVGNLFADYIFPRTDLFPIFQAVGQSILIIGTKILFFVSCIVYLTLKARFDVEVSDSESHIASTFISILLGFLSALLIISTILVYASGSSFVLQSLNMSESFMTFVYSQSYLVKILLDHSSIIFALPAIYFLLDSVFGKE
ncbi:MAG: hypothetical protein U9Q15_04190 [Patescibacteria group bacterium]|nr:hypothetical protein [Patescibacteria group bacterium]